MTRRFPLPTLLALAALALAAGPAAAPALAKAPKGPKKAIVQKYLVTFSEKRTVNWNEPAFSGYENCAYKAFGEAHGSETAEYETRAPVKMVVFQAAYNPRIESRFGTWDFGGGGRDGRVDGTVARQASERVWYEGGSGCGGSIPPQPEPEPTDCGTRKPSYDLGVAVTGNRVSVGLVRRGSGARFEMCELKLPGGMSEEPQPEPKTFSTKRFLKPGGGITVSFTKAYKDASQEGERPWTRSGSLSWKVTFTPKKR